MQYSVTVVAALGLAVYHSWSLTLVTLATIPVSAIVSSKISRWMQPAVEAHAEKLTQASRAATNAIRAIETVKCFNGQEVELSQYASIIKEAARYNLVQARSMALQTGLVRLAILAMFVQGFWYGSHLVNVGQKTPAEILTCFWACLMATQTAEQILSQIVLLERGRAAATALEAAVSNVEFDERNSKLIGRAAPLYCEGHIELRDVSFSYRSQPDRLALNKSSFSFAVGTMTFVIGRSGSGKSTLSDLLMRFYDAQSGEILIDGYAVQTLGINWIRRNITLVQQESVLFNGTIASNIVYGQKDQSTVRWADFEQAIDLSSLQPTIESLPQGPDTVVGAGGSAMSGGQRQRVALARARLRDTPILILDEATSALDHTSKSLIVGRIRKWRAGKTTIIITHDMSQISPNDYVYVLNQGVVVKEGFRHALEEICATDSFGGLDPVSSEPLPPRSNDQCREEEEGIVTADSWPTSMESPHGAMHIAEMQDRRASTSSTSPSSPIAPLLQCKSLAAPAATPNMQEPFAETWDVSSGTVTDKDIEMQPLVRHSGGSQSSFISTLSQKSSIPSPPVVQVSTCKQETTKAEKGASEAQVAPLRGIFLSIWPMLPVRKRFILVLGFTAALLNAAATPVFSYVFSQLLSTFYLPTRDVRSHQAYIYSLSILGVAVIDSATSYLMHYLLESCAQHWIDALRIRAYRNILDQPMVFFSLEENSMERLVETLDRNAEETRSLLSRFAASMFVAITMMTIAVTWSVIMSWRLTLVGLAAAPFLYGVTRRFEHVSSLWEARSNHAASCTNAIFAETFSNIRTVRAYTLEGHFQEKYTTATTSAFHTGLQRAIYSGIFFGLSDASIIFLTALIFYYGAHLVASGTHTVTEIITVFTTFLFSISHVSGLVSLIPQISSSRATASSLLRLACSLAYQRSHESTGTHRPESITSITFHNTTFTYPSRLSSTSPTFISPPLTLAINPTTSTALTGPSGSGKSTLARLLLRLYPPSPSSDPSILINNLPISEIHTPTLRSLLPFVPQNPTLFPTSIAANISYPSPPNSAATTMAAIIAASKQAALHDFITTLPEGYATFIGGGSGTGLSGGQTQRIAIARGLFQHHHSRSGRTGAGGKGRGMVILDEPTSGLDLDTVGGGVGGWVEGVGAAGTTAKSGEEGDGEDREDEDEEGTGGLGGCLVITHDGGMVGRCRDVISLGGGSGDGDDGGGGKGKGKGRVKE